MAIDLKSVTKAALGVLFNLGGDLVKDATYYRPPSYSPVTGVIVTTEQAVPCKILVSEFKARQLGGFYFEPKSEVVLIRASELTAISSPTQGDYLIQANGIRREVVEVPVLDPTDQFWRFRTSQSLNDDWGDLQAHSATEDWGDLSAATAFEDRGALF